MSACLGGSVIVRVLEGSGRVGVEEESGRSVEGMDGRFGEDMVGVRAFDGMVKVGGDGGRGEIVGVEGGAIGVVYLEVMGKSLWSASLMEMSAVESTVTMLPALLLISELSVSNRGEGELE